MDRTPAWLSLARRQDIRVYRPDGKWIAFSYVDKQLSPHFGTEVAAAGDEQPQKRFALGGFSPPYCWTPDSRSLAYLADSNRNLMSAPIDGGKPVPLTNFKTDQIFNFAWSYDGKRLALARGTVTSDIVLISGLK